MTEHSKRPWRLILTEQRELIVDADDRQIVSRLRGSRLQPSDPTFGEIVLCVNALAGLNPEAISEFMEAALKLNTVYQAGDGISRELHEFAFALAKVKNEP